MIQDYEADAEQIIRLAPKTACLPLALVRTQYNFINSVYRNVYLPIILYAKYNIDTQVGLIISVICISLPW